QTPIPLAENCWPAGSLHGRQCRPPLPQHKAASTKSFHSHPSSRRPSNNAPPDEQESDRGSDPAHAAQETLKCPETACADRPPAHAAYPDKPATDLPFCLCPRV